MIEAVALVCTGLLAVMATVSAVNLLTAPRLRPPRVPAHSPDGAPEGARASVLVPARDEEAALPSLLRSLLQHAPAGTEILVLDDGSSDGTDDVVRSFARASEGRVRLLEGRPLPGDWLGKSWACHQLARAATGDVLIFCDADVTLRDDAVTATLALLARSDAGALTALPAQRFRGWWDRALVPLVLHFPMLGTLPLALVARVGAPSVVYGNGQWLAFTRAAYDRVGGHAAVRASIVEDMSLAGRAKRLGVRLVAAVAADAIEVRMYRTRRALFDGFAKNLYPLLGASAASAVAAIFALLLLGLVPIALAFAGFWVPLALLALVRAMHAAIARTPLADLALHPAGVLLACYVAARSMADHRRGRVTWKSRTVVERA